MSEWVYESFNGLWVNESVKLVHKYVLMDVIYLQWFQCLFLWFCPVD